MTVLLRRHWFLLLLAAVLGVGLWQGPHWADAFEDFPRGWLVAGVMFLTALPMAFTQLTTAARKWRAVGLALLLNIAIAPLLAWCVGRMLTDSLATGLLVAAAVPCTLASAAVWTRRGGGNDAIALLVTLVTNVACFAVMPAWLWFFLRADVELNIAELSVRLLGLVVAPIAAAQLLRISPAVAQAATRRKTELSLAAQLGILSMVFFGALSAGHTLANMDYTSVGVMQWLALLTAVFVLHLLLFGMGWWLGEVAGVERRDCVAVAIAGSQKTLMIGLDVALGLAALGFGGIVILPMVAYHIVQLVVDTVLMDWIRAKEP